ncbi:hypothetical protein LCGC14_2247460 [marine sediment metagenome]|uniref:Uncharacterized protein n=1 Tax=marine sediment metagenome TaxID=412755 RepID=A0A0F9D3U7_9ZZZZ
MTGIRLGEGPLEGETDQEWQERVEKEKEEGEEVEPVDPYQEYLEAGVMPGNLEK